MEMEAALPYPNHREAETLRILAVVVLYKLSPQESPTLRALLASASQAPAQLQLQIMLWDNTPGGQDAGELPPGLLYKQAPDNPGLARAYNHALELAAEQGYTWLLTLDQDSVLPITFLQQITEAVSSVSANAQIAAIVPQVTGDGLILSPFRFLFGALPYWFSPGYTGSPETAVFAVNSASLLRVEALLQVGGYDPLFPLDASDLCLFHKLHKSGMRVSIAGDIEVHHEFSLLKQEQRMSIERYEAMLLDECAFWDLYMKPLARLERMLRLVARVLRDAIQRKNAHFRTKTIAEIFRRLTTSKSRRIANWKDWTMNRTHSNISAMIENR